MHKLTGYTNRWGVKQGAAVRFHVTSAGGAPFDLRFVRFICADPNPEGPGYEEVAMASPIDGTVAGLEQGAWTGSFGQVDGLVLPAGGLSLRATVWPTTPAKGVQGIVALALPGWRMALAIATQEGPGRSRSGRAFAPRDPPAEPALGRAEAARGHRPGHPEPPGDPDGGRADRKPR